MNKVISHSLFTDFDIDLFKAGKHFRLYEKLGAHLVTVDGVDGVYFAVWAPTAHSVSVLGILIFGRKESICCKCVGIHQVFGKGLFLTLQKGRPINIK